MEAGISDWQIIEGALAELRQQPGPFLPSTGDFLAMCRRAQLSEWRMPSEAEAFGQLQRFFGPRGVVRDFKKLNPAVYAAYVRMDWSAVSCLPTREQRKAFAEAWGQVQEDILKGRQLPKPLPPECQLEEKKKDHKSSENLELHNKTITELMAQF